MTIEQKTFIRNAWITIIAAVTIMIIGSVFDVFGTISGNSQKIETLEQTKMNVITATKFFTDITIKQAEQYAKWEEYRIANEKEKQQILKEIETIQTDIKVLIQNQKQVMRGN